MKSLNSDDSSTDPQGTPLVAHWQVDFALLVMTLWAWRSSQFSLNLLTYPASTHQFSDESMGNCFKGPDEIKAQKIHISPLVRSAHHLIIERNEAGQVWFAIGKPVLAAPNHLPVFHEFRNNFWVDLFHHLPRDWDEADQPVVPSVFEDKCGICLFCSPQKPPLISMTFKRWCSMAPQWHLPVPSTPLDTSYLVTCTCVSLIGFSISLFVL